MTIVALIVVILSVIVTDYIQEKLDGKPIISRFSKTEHRKLQPVSIVEVAIQGVKYIATAVVDRSGEVIELPIDKAMMNDLPAAKAVNSKSPLAKVLVFTYPNGRYELAPEEVRYKLDIDEKNDEEDNDEKLFAAKDKIKTSLLTISSVLAFFMPGVSIAVTILTFILRVMFEPAETCKKDTKCSIIDEQKPQEEIIPKEKIPDGYDDWSETQKFLFTMNRKVEQARDHANKGKVSTNQDSAVKEETVEEPVMDVQDSEPEGTQPLKSVQEPLKDQEEQGFFTKEELASEEGEASPAAAVQSAQETEAAEEQEDPVDVQNLEEDEHEGEDAFDDGESEFAPPEIYDVDSVIEAEVISVSDPQDTRGLE